jgi:hypothetical protein
MVVDGDEEGPSHRRCRRPACDADCRRVSGILAPDGDGSERHRGRRPVPPSPVLDYPSRVSVIPHVMTVLPQCNGPGPVTFSINITPNPV